MKVEVEVEVRGDSPQVRVKVRWKVEGWKGGRWKVEGEVEGGRLKVRSPH